MLFLHASPRVCSHWQRQWLWFAALLTPEYGYFEYTVSQSLIICLEKLYVKNAKKVRQWKKQDVNTGPANTHTDCKAIPSSCMVT